MKMAGNTVQTDYHFWCVPLSPACSTHRGDVLGGELVGGVGDEQARLSHRTITHHHTLYGLHLGRKKVEKEA